MRVTVPHRPATIAAMCELLAARADEPFELAALWGLAEGLERYGLAGYGWGVAWVRLDGSLDAHRATVAFREDGHRDEIGRTETTAALVHLRRPSRFSWLGMADTQPFVDGAGRFAFAHNGELARHRRFRAAYREAGRIQGKADSEVGMRWLEDAWSPERSAGDHLAALHEALGGSANLAVLEPGGAATLYAGNAENPVFGFRLGELRVLATAVYSLDRSLFRLVAPGAREPRLVARGRAATL
jgi:glutamine phosphoribosylpyrophosphate amidotransferase